jgi:hypothetical protein
MTDFKYLDLPPILEEKYTIESLKKLLTSNKNDTNSFDLKQGNVIYHITSNRVATLIIKEFHYHDCKFTKYIRNKKISEYYFIQHSNKKVGIEKEWANNKLVMRMDHGTGEIIRWWKNGQIKSRGFLSESNKLWGEYQEWAPNGTILNHCYIDRDAEIELKDAKGMLEHWFNQINLKNIYNEIE